ncbi:Rrf2-linked NADH-flavin reductase [Streptococcus sp. DD13]|nr:Rrf2-linked NADH-flavin reductase [Streptococcus sp. DD13]
MAGEVFTTNAAGESQISYADYAIAMLDEIEQAQHIQERISVLGK